LAIDCFATKAIELNPEYANAYYNRGRPSICTEYMACTKGSMCQNSLPIFEKNKTGCYNWGFVAGKSGTTWPQESRKDKQAVVRMRNEGKVLKVGDPFPEPEVWFHDIYRIVGTLYSQEEIDFIKKMTGGKAS